MSYPVMNIIHHLPGRVRLSLSMPPRRIEKFETEVLGHAGIHCVKFSPITRSVLVYYNPIEIEMSEIIIRLGTALSIEYDMCSVYVENKKQNVGVSIIDNYALGALIVAWIVRNGWTPLTNISNLLEWNAGVSTLAAVVNHGISEIKFSGTPDPEVVTVIYLLNSMLKNQFLGASTITWISTFIRHLTGEESDRISIQAFQAFSQENRIYYDVAVKSEETLYHKSIIKIVGDVLRKYVGIRSSMKVTSLLNQINSVSSKQGDALEGLASEKDIIFLRLEF